MAKAKARVRPVDRRKVPAKRTLRGVLALPPARRKAAQRKGARVLQKIGKRRAFKAGKEAKTLGRKGGKETQRRNRDARRQALVDRVEGTMPGIRGAVVPKTPPSKPYAGIERAGVIGGGGGGASGKDGPCFTGCGNTGEYCFGCANYICDACDVSVGDLRYGGHAKERHLEAPVDEGDPDAEARASEL